MLQAWLPTTPARSRLGRLAMVLATRLADGMEAVGVTGDTPTCVEREGCPHHWHYWRCPEHPDYGKGNPEPTPLDTLRNALAELASHYAADDVDVRDATAALAQVAALAEAAQALLKDDDMPNHWADCVCSYCTRNRALRDVLARFDA